MFLPATTPSLVQTSKPCKPYMKYWFINCHKKKILPTASRSTN